MAFRLRSSPALPLSLVQEKNKDGALENLYHVLLEGRRVGPYDRRTIVGMRIKKTLRSKDLLVAPDGSQLTVSDLVRNGFRKDPAFQPSRSGSYSVVQGTFPGSLVEVRGKGHEIPPFKGEIELRVQTKVLRIAGTLRQVMGRVREDRVKIPLEDIVHARLRGSLVDMWMRAGPAQELQRVVVEVFTPEAAGELVECFPNAKPWPQAESTFAPLKGKPERDDRPWIWGAIVGSTLLVGLLIVWVVTRAA